MVNIEDKQKELRFKLVELHNDSIRDMNYLRYRISETLSRIDEIDEFLGIKKEYTTKKMLKQHKETQNV